MKILKNYLYNLSYQLLLIILPIITTPYVTRIFSSNELGSYAFYNSIVAYFVLLATLGIGNYGTRLISQSRNSLDSSFWSLYHLQFLSTGLAIALYLFVLMLVPKMQHPIAYLLIISILGKGLDISWFFQGMEDFRRITIRNMLVKLTGVVSIFLFIRSSSDLLLYILFLVGFEFLGQLSMWLPASKLVGPWKWNWSATKEHITPVMYLFFPTIAITLYVSLDRTMLGIMASANDVGIYDQAFKIINILLTLVTSLGTVMLPRIASLLADNQHDQVNRLYELSFLVYNLIIIPIIFGILFVNQDFVAFFLGPDFQEAKYAIAIMIWKVFFIGWTNIMGLQILIPHGKNKEFMISTSLPAVFSLGLNILLIPSLGYIGAAITSVFSEALVWIIQLFATRKQLKQIRIMPALIKILIAGSVMLAGLFLFKSLLIFTPLVNTMLSMFVGGIFYIVSILVLKVADFHELRDVVLRK